MRSPTLRSSRIPKQNTQSFLLDKAEAVKRERDTEGGRASPGFHFTKAFTQGSTLAFL